jgi:hypothetical protein
MKTSNKLLIGLLAFLFLLITVIVVGAGHLVTYTVN